jgi:hypothetical protein
MKTGETECFVEPHEDPESCHTHSLPQSPCVRDKLVDLDPYDEVLRPPPMFDTEGRRNVRLSLECLKGYRV